jgi:putative Holliday junction resolvase
VPRILGLDWGEKRFGIAMSDPSNVLATPLTVLARKNKVTPWDDLRKIIEDNGIKTVVVGLPLRTDGKQGEKVFQVRQWIDEAHSQFPGVKFVEMDERFTTQEASRVLREKGVRAIDQRKVVDKVAAALILEQFLKLKSRNS